MGEVKGQGHIVYPVSNRCTTLSFHVNRTNHSWDMANRLFDFEKSKVKVTGEVKGQGHIIYPTDSLPFRFTSIGPTIPEIWSKECLNLKNTSVIFFLNSPKKKFQTEFHQYLIRWSAWLTGYSYQVLWWLDEWFSFYHADKQIYLNQCHSRDLGSRSWKGHPVHFPRPTFSLSQISKV